MASTTNVNAINERLERDDVASARRLYMDEFSDLSKNCHSENFTPVSKTIKVKPIKNGFSPFDTNVGKMVVQLVIKEMMKNSDFL
jgi:hypothetical protein